MKKKKKRVKNKRLDPTKWGRGCWTSHNLMGLFDLVEQRRQRIPLIACLLYESCYHFSFIFSFSYTTTTIFLFRFIAILFFFFLLPFVFFYFSIFFFFFFLCFILFFFCFVFLWSIKKKRLIIWYPSPMHFYFFIVT